MNMSEAKSHGCLGAQGMLKVMLLLSTFIILNACSSNLGNPVPTEFVHGHFPTWDLPKMVKLSDAVVIGTVREEIQSKVSPAGPEGEEDLFLHVYTDYALDVEQFLFLDSNSTSADKIAIVAVGGEANYKGKNVEFHFPGEPTFEVGERVLLFLQHPPDDSYELAGHHLPPGFTKETYYDVLASLQYGKIVLEPGEDKGEDKLSGKSVTIKQVEDAVSDYRISQ